MELNKGEKTLLACVELELNQKLNYRKSSALQGVLFEQIEPEYAELLHQNRNHPYSQCLLLEQDKCIWQIKTYEEEAYHQIIEKLMQNSFQEFQLKQTEQTVQILGKNLSVKPKRKLMEQFNTERGEKFIHLRVLTPMAFKQRGRYVILPDCRLMYQSLMNKYSSVSQTLEMFDEETLEQLVENSEIIRYRIQSASFPLEGVSVPGFTGEFTIKFHGSELLARYIRLLCMFGEYSGIGIKTSMGMGAIRIEEWRGRYEGSRKETDYR